MPSAPQLPPVMPRRSRNLVDPIVEQIGGRIRDGSMAPGDRLPTEIELVARFDVSRTVIREAISRLQAAELVQTRHGVGTFVRPSAGRSNFRLTQEDLETITDVISVLELRMGLESEAAGLAAQRRTTTDLKSMRRAMRGFERAASDGSDAVAADFELHRAIARAAGNRHIESLLSYLGMMIIPRARIGTAPSPSDSQTAYLARVHAEHERIVSAIEAGDDRAARAAMRAHLSNSRKRLQARAKIAAT